MSPSRKEEIVRQFVDLEDFGEELFAMAAESPAISRRQKKAILHSIVGKKRWNIPQFALVSTASAFAAFAFIFGYAQMTSAPHFLNTLRIAKPTTQKIPTPQEVQQVQQQLLQQQTKIDELEKTGASAADIAKAVDTLNDSVKKTEKDGFRVTKTTDKSGKTFIYVKPIFDNDTKKIQDNSGKDSGESSTSGHSSGSINDD